MKMNKKPGNLIPEEFKKEMKWHRIGIQIPRVQF